FASLTVESPGNATYRRELQNTHFYGAMSSSGIGEATSWFPSTGDFAAAERESKEALPLAERIAARDPGDTRAREDLLYALLLVPRTTARRDPGAAIPVFQRARDLAASIEPANLNPRAKVLDRASHCAMAEPLAKLGRREDALAAVERGLAIALDDA